MSHDDERQESPQSKLLRGSSERKWTAVCQLLCGIFAVGCGIALISLKLPHVRYHIEQIDSLENSAIGIWGGLVFLVTAVPYIAGRKNKTFVFVYLGFSIFSLMIALLGITLSMLIIVGIIEEKYFGYSCNREHYSCCFNDDYCYHHHGSYQDYTPDPLNDYDSKECQDLRLAAIKKTERCLNNVWHLFGPHQIVLGILIAVLSIEVFASAYGACASVASLCDCRPNCNLLRKRNRDVVYVPVAFDQPINSGDHGTVLPASDQAQEERTITATVTVADPTVSMSHTDVSSGAASDPPTASPGTSTTIQSQITPILE